MFGSRKHRPPKPQPLNASTASPNAATAAASAFNRRPSGNASLSAAAAAAALKARPHTPTNVGELQTKRTLRRSASQSSSAGRSTPDTRGRPGHLRRQSSSGSMTERTFRSPSPGTPSQRSLSSGGVPRSPYQMDEPPPPVPALPASVNMEAAKKQGTKPKSLGITTTPVRTASQKMKDKSGPWFGAAKQGDMSSVRTSDAILSMSPTQMGHVLDEVERPESGEGSVNFSYPARVRVSSPTPSSPTFARPEELSPAPAPASHPKQKRRSATMSPPRGGANRATRSSSVAQDQTLVYDANSRRMVPRSELLALEYKIQAASEAKPKTKKHTPARAGSHLAKGTVGRPQGTAVESGAPNNAQLAAAASFRPRRTEERQPAPYEPEEQYEQASLEPVPQPLAREPETRKEARPVRRTKISTSPASNAPEVLPAAQLANTERDESGLQRRPSVVREETEESESEPEPQGPARVATPPNASHALDSVPVRQNVYAHGVPSPPRSDLTEDQSIEGRDVPVELAAAPAQPSSEPREAQIPRRDPRTQSISPARTARFGSVQENLTVRHEPPPRSISPGKSVLKQQSPSRGASPAGVSDSSEANTAAQDSGIPSRKKSVRVSFDDDSTAVVGEAAGGNEPESPVSSSPQSTSKRPWYNNLGIGKKKDAPPLEEDEFMKPRPVLPTFGSIRGRKSSPQPTGERPLVRPLEPPHDTSGPLNPGSEGTGAGDTVGQSSDHALGGIIHEQGPRNEANISKFREPLPPVVTSIEGNGYGSDSDSLDSDAALMADTPRLESEESRVSDASTLVADQARRPNGAAELQPVSSAVHIKDFAAAPSTAVQTVEAGEVPTIAIIQPSPLPSERKQEPASYIPGEFPETETEPDTDDASSQTKGPSPTNTAAPIRHVTFEPVVQKEDAKSTIQTPATVLATQPAISEDTDDSDGSSLYSDAYEDLSEIEGDGFQSLDAVLDSPLPITPPKSVFQGSQTQQPGSLTSTPTGRASQNGAVALATQQHTGKPIGDWEAAKAYWRSLTADRRAQLETEATEEAGAEGDLEGTKLVSKPRRKKSMEKRNAEKKAREQQRAAVDPDRVYMIKPGTKADEFHPPMKNTPRGRPVSGKDEPRLRLRKSMRGAEPQPVNNGAGMRKSLRSEGSDQSKARQRPVSYQPSLGTTSETAGPNKHSRSVSEGQGASSISQPKLRRRGSDSSTSSFKRARATSQGFAFRKTMRTGPNPADEPRDQQSSRFSVRSMSPPVSMTGGMRTTLRGDPKTQRRTSQDSGKGYLRFSGSFGQKSKGKKASRFGDDSSDDDDVPHRFASRFEDSSDEDVAPQPLPSMTIPKTMRSGKAAKKAPSPPLPEEEELSGGEDTAGGQGTQTVALGSDGVPRSQTEPSIRQSRSGRGAISTANVAGSDDSGRPTSRRGFMSSVLRRNKKRDGAITRAGPAESAARRDTNLERSTDELNAIRSNGGSGSSMRLHKRTASMPAESSNWPLAGDATEAASDDEEEEHDQQAAGGGASFTDGETIGTNATGKKKRFGALRRMLKIDD